MFRSKTNFHLLFLLVAFVFSSREAYSIDAISAEGGGGVVIKQCLKDTDLDRVCDRNDNCVTTSNPSQLNTDADSLGDACDSDDDNDGLVDTIDCAPLDNARWRVGYFFPDADGDGFGECSGSGVKQCYGTNPPAGYLPTSAPCDNCTSRFNPGQTDVDGDGLGNYCDNDETLGDGHLRVITDSARRHHVFFDATPGPTAGGGNAVMQSTAGIPAQGVSVKVIGREFHYPNQPPLPIRLQVRLGSGAFQDLTAADGGQYLLEGDTIFVDLGGDSPELTWKAVTNCGGCSAVPNKQSDGPWAYTFVDGDNFADLIIDRNVDPADGMDDQLPLNAFLADYIVEIDGEQRMSLTDQQMIVLFELGTTVTNSDSYDMQDLVLLITPTEDSDADGIGDADDGCIDTDNDGFGTPGYPSATCPEDNCPLDHNPLQENFGGDPNLGFYCDPEELGAVGGVVAGTSGPQGAPGRLLLRMNPGVNIEQLQALTSLISTYGVTSTSLLFGTEFSSPLAAERLGLTRSVLLKFDVRKDLETVANAYLATGLLELAEYDYMGEVGPVSMDGGGIGMTAGQNVASDPALSCAAGGGTYCPIDPFFAQQLNLHDDRRDFSTMMEIDADIDAPEAWSIHRGDEPDATQVVVAVLDTGLRSGHEDLTGRVLTGWNYVENVSNTNDSFGHGTEVTGIIAANGNNIVGSSGYQRGMAGIHFGAKILPLQTCADSNGRPNTSYVAQAIEDAADGKFGVKADVINMSFKVDAPTELLKSAIEYASGLGVIIVASSGNDATPPPQFPDDESVDYPAAYPEVIAVSAIDNLNNRLLSPKSSNKGPEVDIAAPGDHILTFSLTNSTQYQNGPYSNRFGLTSAAAAHVSGVAALVKSYKSCLTNEEIRGILLDSADQLGDERPNDIFGYGRVNAHRALLQAGSTNCALDGNYFGFSEEGFIVANRNTASGTKFAYLEDTTSTLARVFGGREYLGVSNTGSHGTLIIGREYHDDGVGFNGYIYRTNGTIHSNVEVSGAKKVLLRDINAHRYVVGSAMMPDNSAYSFIYQNGTVTPLLNHPLFNVSAYSASALRLSDDNIILGTLRYVAGGPQIPFLFDINDSARGETQILPQRVMTLAFPTEYQNFQTKTVASISDLHLGESHTDLVITGYVYNMTIMIPAGSVVESYVLAWTWNSALQAFEPTRITSPTGQFYPSLPLGDFAPAVNRNKQIVSTEMFGGPIAVQSYARDVSGVWQRSTVQAPDWTDIIIARSLNSSGQVAALGATSTAPSEMLPIVLELP